MLELHGVVLGAAVILTLVALLYVYRVVAGPTVYDRMLGLSGVGTKTILILILIGELYGELAMVVDIALGYALLNFLAALASARYLAQKGSTE